MAMTFWHFMLTVWFADVSGKQTPYTWEMQATDYTTALIDAATVLSALDAISDAEIAGFGVHGRYYEDAFTLPGSGVYNANTAALLLHPATEESTRPVVSIPAPKDAIFMGPTGSQNNIVDILNEDVLAFVALFIENAELYVSDGEVVDGIISGERVHVRMLT
jgi:hypothetical protein